MKTSCVWTPRVKNKKGEKVKSPLFSKLSEIFDRDTTKIFYKISKSKEFLEKLKNEYFIVTDSEVPSELDFDFFVEITGIGHSEKELQKKIIELNDKYSGEKLSIEDALNKCKDFNADNKYNSIFLCNIYHNTENPNLYDVRIVQKTPKNEVEFERFIKTENYLNSCLSIISKIGYNISKEDGKYIFSDSEKLLTLFESIIDNDSIENTSDNLLKEFCSVIYSLEKKKGNINTLLERVIKYINDNKDTLKTDNAEDFLLEKLVDSFKNIQDNNNSSVIQRLVSYLKNKILNAFSLLKGVNIAEIKKNADYIIRNYFNGTKINTILLDDNDTSLDKPVTQILNKAVEELNKLIETFNATGDKKASKTVHDMFVKNILNNSISSGNIAKNYEYDRETLERVLLEGVTYLEGLEEQLKDYEKQPKDKYLQIDVAKKIYEASCVTSSLEFIKQELDHFFGNIVGSSDVDIEYKKILLLRNDLNKLLFDLRPIINNLEIASYVSFLQNLYGSDYVYQKGGIIFERKKSGFGFTKIISDDISIKDIIEGKRKDTNEEISWYREWLSSAYDNTDIQCKMLDYANKQSENGINEEMSSELKEIENIADEIFSVDGFSRNKQYLLFEKDENGVNTGNYISEYNQGLFERDTKNYIRQLYIQWGKSFTEEVKKEGRNVKDLSINYKKSKWEKYRDDELKKYYESPTEKGSKITRGKQKEIILKSGKKKKIWIAGDYYLNENYKKLIETYEGIEKPLQKLIDFKYKQDQRLNGFGAPLYRAPQIDSYTTNMISNAITDKSWSYIKSLIRRKLHNICNINQNSFEWGSDVNKVDNLNSNDIFNQQIDQNSNNDKTNLINTLTLYGVKKIYDPNLMTTDIFHGLIAYTNMAITYEYKNKLMSMLNMGLDLMKNRKIYNKTKKGYVEVDSERNIKRINSYVRYNILGKRYSFAPNVFAVLFKKLVHFGTMIALGGNDVTAAVNLGTGLTDVIREGLSSGKYSLKDLAAATALYSKSLLNKGVKVAGGRVINKSQLGNEITDAYIDAFSRRFDIQNKNKINFNNIKAGRNYFSKIVGNLPNLLFAAYEFGDSVMRVLPTMSVFENKKLISLADDKIYTMLDVYKQTKDGVILYASLNIDDSETLNEIYNKINDIYNKIKTSSNANSLGNKIHFSEEEKKVLKKYGLQESPSANKETLLLIKNAMDNLNVFFLSENEKDATKNKKKYLKLNEILSDLSDSNDKNYKDVIEKHIDFITNELNIEVSNKFGDRESTIDELIDQQEKLQYNLQDETRILSEIKSMLTDFHGIYDNIDSTMLQATYAGSLIMGMRGYVFGYLSRSFAGYNKWTGKEGFLTTYMKAITFYATGSNDEKYIKQIFKVGMLLASPLFQKILIRSMIKDGWSEHQAQNAVRCVTELCIISGELLVRALLKRGIAYLDDENDKKELTEEEKEYISGRKNILYRRLYMVERLLYERLAYTEPTMMIKEFFSISDMMPSGFSALIKWVSALKDFAICKYYSDEIDNIYYDVVDGRVVKLDEFNDKSKIIKNIKDLEESYPSLKSKLYVRDVNKSGKVGKSKSEEYLKRTIPFYRDYVWSQTAEERYKSWLFFRNMTR